MTPGPAARVTVDLPTFRAWRAAAAEWVVPDGGGPEPPRSDGVMPPAVAASLAVRAQAECTAALAIRGPAVLVSVHLSTVGALAGVLALTRWAAGSGEAPAGEWVHVALLSAQDAAAELLGWVPDAEAGRVPEGSTLRLTVTHWVGDDPGAHRRTVVAELGERRGVWAPSTAAVPGGVAGMAVELERLLRVRPAGVP